MKLESSKENWDCTNDTAGASQVDHHQIRDVEHHQIRDVEHHQIREVDQHQIGEVDHHHAQSRLKYL